MIVFKFNPFYMEPTPDRVERFREIFKKEYGKEFTYAEAQEATTNLVGFFKLLIEIDRRKKKEENNS